MAQVNRQLVETLATLLAGVSVPQQRKRGKKAKGVPRGTKLTDEQRAAFRAANDKEAVELFTKAGFKDVRPRENVLSAKLWIAQGRIPMKGQKAIKLSNGLPLFHFDQTTVLTEEQKLAAATPANQTAA